MARQQQARRRGPRRYQTDEDYEPGIRRYERQISGGRAGGDPDEQEHQDDEADSGEQPDQPGAPRRSRLAGGTAEGAGAFLALFAYPLLANLLQGGPAQMWGWVRAKWVNQPWGGPSAPGPAPSAGTPAQPGSAGPGVRPA